VTASSTTVLANLAYLIGAVVVAVILGLLVWLKHRKPKSVDANMASFRRGLSALAPDEGPRTPARRTEPIRIRPPGLTHVKLEPARIPAPAEDQPADPDDPEGGSPG
jgi:hypothetical protein